VGMASPALKQLIFMKIIYILFILYKMNYFRIISLLYPSIKLLTSPNVFQIINLLLVTMNHGMKDTIQLIHNIFSHTKSAKEDPNEF
jgi:hypothetical protein